MSNGGIQLEETGRGGLSWRKPRRTGINRLLQRNGGHIERT
jgi:hypothetical protein